MFGLYTSLSVSCAVIPIFICSLPFKPIILTGATKYISNGGIRNSLVDCRLRPSPLSDSPWASDVSWKPGSFEFCPRTWVVGNHSDLGLRFTVNPIPDRVSFTWFRGDMSGYFSTKDIYWNTACYSELSGFWYQPNTFSHVYGVNYCITIVIQ